MERKKTKVACHGVNGHQILRELRDNPRAELAAVCAIPRKTLEDWGGPLEGVKVCASLDELLDTDAELVSLCSPVRRKQPEEAVRALSAGRHVLAEKPAAFSKAELDAILAAAAASGAHFREMGGTELCPPFPEIKALVAQGAIGEVVQAYGMKSYPWFVGRSQDPAVDGGLFQAGVHALRFICHLCGARVVRVEAMATRKGNPVHGGALHMAAGVLLELSTGAIGGISVNYLNPVEFGLWGNDHVRLHGTEGMVEAVDGLKVGRIVSKRIVRPLETAGRPLAKSYFEHYLDLIRDGAPMPTPFEVEMGFIEDSAKVIAALQR